MILTNGTQNTYLLDVKTKQGTIIPVKLLPFSKQEDPNWLRLMDKHLPSGVTMQRGVAPAAPAKEPEPKKKKDAPPSPPVTAPAEPEDPEPPPPASEPQATGYSKQELADMTKPELMKLSAKMKAEPKGSKKVDYIKAILKKQKDSK